MSYPFIERRLYPEGIPFSPTGTGSTTLGRVGVKGAPGERVIGAAARVIRAGNGTGTVSLGRTGAVTSFLTTADMGGAGPPAGLKEAPTGAELAGNGTVFTAPTNVVGDYIIGTNSVHPIVRFMLFVVQECDWDSAVRDLGN